MRSYNKKDVTFTIKKTIATFFTRSKVLIMVFLAFETFDLVKNLHKSFDLLPKKKQFKLIKLLTLQKKSFNLVPKLKKLSI